MGISEIINIILAGLTVVLGCFEYNSYIKNIIKKAANEAINFAENLKVSGFEKMNKAIEFVKLKIPKIFKPFVRKKFIRKIIQNIFTEKQLGK